jgi:hypothetical protein
VTSESGFRVCPSCHEEYTLVALQCVHCDVALVSPDSLPAEEEELADFPPASELVYLRIAPLPWIRGLSEALEKASVPHRVEPGRLADPPEGQRPEIFGDVDLFGLYVLPEDVASAREFDSRIAVQVLPEEAEDVGEEEDDACPACGAGLGHDATSCPDCGLGLG